MLLLQVVLKFKYNFWQKIVQGADFFGHVPQSSEGRGHCGLFYDLCKKVTILSCSMHIIFPVFNLNSTSKFSLVAFKIFHNHLGRIWLGMSIWMILVLNWSWLANSLFKLFESLRGRFSLTCCVQLNLL